MVQLESRASREHFGLHLLTAEPLTNKLLEVLEGRRALREGQMTAIGCEFSASLDWCKRTGEKAGGEWYGGPYSTPVSRQLLGVARARV